MTHEIKVEKVLKEAYLHLQLYFSFVSIWGKLVVPYLNICKYSRDHGIKLVPRY